MPKHVQKPLVPPATVRGLQTSLTIAEAALIMGCHENTVRKLCLTGALQAYKVGVAWRIPPAALACFMQPKQLAPAERRAA